MAKKLKFETYIKIQYYNKTERITKQITQNNTDNTEQHRQHRTTQNNTKQHKTTQTMAMSPSKIRLLQDHHLCSKDYGQWW